MQHPSSALSLSRSGPLRPCGPTIVFVYHKYAQTATRIYLKAKLPARDDINIDSLDFNAHEIAVAQVSLKAWTLV